MTTIRSLPPEMVQHILRFLVAEINLGRRMLSFFPCSPSHQSEEIMDVLEARLVCKEWLSCFEGVNVLELLQQFRRFRKSACFTPGDILKDLGYLRVENPERNRFLKGIACQRVRIPEEPDAGETIDISTVKDLTGGPPMYGRNSYSFNRMGHFFRPYAVECVYEALWSRVCEIPFTSVYICAITVKSPSRDQYGTLQLQSRKIKKARTEQSKRAIHGRKRKLMRQKKQQRPRKLTNKFSRHKARFQRRY